MAVANLVNLERVDKSYGIRPLLDDVSFTSARIHACSNWACTASATLARIASLR